MQGQQDNQLHCTLVQPGEPFTGKQGLQCTGGISAESAGARHIHMHLLTIPPGGRARAHKHAGHETAIYALRGSTYVWHGERLEHHSVIRQGYFFYIPADMPHLPYNPSSTEEVIAVIARSDPSDQESVDLLPELEYLRPPQ